MNNTIGERIKQIRETADPSGKKITQETFGKSIGLNRNTVFQYEVGAINPSKRTLESICEKYNVSIDWLLTGEGEPYIDTEETFAEELKQKYKLDSLGIAILKSYMSMNKSEQEVLEKFIKNITKELD